MKIMISGGGIGGLTTALTCLHHGFDIQVFEQADAVSEVGAGIQIPPNAMHIFEALNLTETIADKAFQPEALETRMGESGMTLFKIPLGQAALKRWRTPYLHTHRADYIEALQKALKERAPDALMLGVTIDRYEETAEGVTAISASGERFAGDVLIGADGIHSRLRTQMLGPENPRFTGNIAWRAVVPIEKLGADLPAPTACAWMGRGRHAVTYRLRRGTLANFVGVVERDDWTTESWNEPGAKEEALRDFAGWHPTITNLIENTADDALFRWALFDRNPLKHWVSERVALLGDAAHPMLPFMAQGAAMAVEDAWALAAELKKIPQNQSLALKNYEQRRHARATMTQAESRANAKTFHQKTTMGRLKTYGPMWLGGRFAPGAVRARMDRFYAHDETASD